MGFFNIEDILYITEGDLSAKERNSLPDSAFGLPEDRKYPIPDAKHVYSAIRLFGHCPEDKKPQLAKRIKAKATEYGIDINDNSQITKYAKKW